jgi:hypothetical protein
MENREAKMYVIFAYIDYSSGRCSLTSYCSNLHFENLKSSYLNMGLVKDTKLIHLSTEEISNILTDVTADLQG